MAAAAVLLFALPFCAPADDEKALREMVESAARLTEEHDIGGLMDLTTGDFHAQPGQIDRLGARRVLFMAFRYYGELKVLHPEPRIVLDPREGGPAVSFPFLMVKRNQAFPELKKFYEDPGGWLREAGKTADLYRFHLKVEKREGDWRVREAALEKWTGMGFRE